MGGLEAFLHMGGYAAYIWPAYGVTAVVLIGLLALSVRSMRDAERTASDERPVRPRRGGRT